MRRALSSGRKSFEAPGLLGEGLQTLEAAHAVLGRVVDQRQLGEGVAPRQQGGMLGFRQLRLRGGGEVLLLDVGFGPGAVRGALAQVHPGVDLQRETLGHGRILSAPRDEGQGEGAGGEKSCPEIARLSMIVPG